MNRELCCITFLVLGALGMFVGFLVGARHGYTTAQLILLRWTIHDSVCPSYNSLGARCDCGLEQALEGP